jgi:hypothetical protein
VQRLGGRPVGVADQGMDRPATLEQCARDRATPLAGGADHQHWSRSIGHVMLLGV